MTKILVVLMILCASSASALLLEDICRANHFLYLDIWVNAFHRVQQNVTYEPLIYYLVDRSITCDPFEFVNRSNHLEALRARNQ